ncbi:MAG TPA: hypothetical protein VH415_05335 [Nitrososphaeraceae archaeon]|jgi:hypothetical protein
MLKHSFADAIVSNRKIAVVTGAALIFLVIIDLLMTRQIMPYTNDTEFAMFILTVTFGYGIGSVILLKYAGGISKEIRVKSRFINLVHWSVTIIQFSLLGFLSFVLISELYYGLYNSNTRFFTTSVFAISSISATLIMGIIAFKFFSWYKLSNKKNLTVLLYGIAALTLAMSIAEDAGTKLIMLQVVVEKSPSDAVTKSSFVYKASEQYNGEIEYKLVNQETTTLTILPNSNLLNYNLLNSIILPIGFVFRWGASTMLLRNFYQRVSKLPISLWIVLSLPLILYLIGKMPGFFAGESLAGVDEAYRYYFRILFRAGTIGGNILFGLVFFIVARKIKAGKLKDYLTMAAIGDTIVGLALSTSALQVTYGVAAHSLVLLSSYLFCMGLYVSAIAVSQDKSLRKSIKRSIPELFDNVGSPQVEKELLERAVRLLKANREEMELETGGVSYSLTEEDVRQYMTQVIRETSKQKDRK